MKTEAEMERFIGRHSRGILEPGKGGRGKEKKNPLEPSKEAWDCPYLDFGLLAFRTIRGQISLKFAGCGRLLQKS